MQRREIIVGTVGALCRAMRFVTVLILALAGCGNATTDDDGGMPADCPTGFQSPAYCFSGAGGTANSCGSCEHVGELCDYFEATLVCASDHNWRCSYAGGSSGGCPHSDGGL